MKPLYPLIGLALLTSSAISGDAKIPVGTLSVNKNLVEKDEKPLLTWNITHPISALDEVISVDGNDNISVLKDVKVDVYMVGTGVTSDGGSKQYTTQSYIGFGNGWEHVFTGKGDDVIPSVVHISKELSAGTKITFAAKFNNYCYNHDDEVILLREGDSAPGGLGDNGGASLESYLKAYVEDGKLSLGDLDVIYCAELTHTDKGSNGYDLQDSIVLLRFSEVTD